MVPDSPEKPANRRSSVGEPSSPKITSELGTLVRTRRRSNRVVIIPLRYLEIPTFYSYSLPRNATKSKDLRYMMELAQERSRSLWDMDHELYVNL
uniref:Uncharacterized protein n=1 Tax=Helianthus annuus TaxID=4232 RepID=A0A251T1Q3_HELAN